MESVYLSVIEFVPDPEDVFHTTGYLNHFTPGGLPAIDKDIRCALTFEDIEECVLLVAYFNRIGWLCHLRRVRLSKRGMEVLK